MYCYKTNELNCKCWLILLMVSCYLGMVYTLQLISTLSRNMIHQLCRVLTVINDRMAAMPTDGNLLLDWAQRVLTDYKRYHKVLLYHWKLLSTLIGGNCTTWHWSCTILHVTQLPARLFRQTQWSSINPLSNINSLKQTSTQVIK